MAGDIVGWGDQESRGTDVNFDLTEVYLKGAGSAIQRASSVIIECQDLEPDDPRVLREGSCLYKEAAEYMCSKHNFCPRNGMEEFAVSGAANRMGNVFFATQQV